MVSPSTKIGSAIYVQICRLATKRLSSLLRLVIPNGSALFSPSCHCQPQAKCGAYTVHVMASPGSFPCLARTAQYTCRKCEVQQRIPVLVLLLLSNNCFSCDLILHLQLGARGKTPAVATFHPPPFPRISHLCAMGSSNLPKSLV